MNNLALQWKYRKEYRTTESTRSAEVANAQKSNTLVEKNLIISTPAANAISNVSVSKVENNSATASTNKFSGTLSRKEVKTIVLAKLKENGITKIEALKTINKIQKENKANGNDKSQLVALLICFFIGSLGIHRFYLGYIWQGVVQLLTAGGCGIWVLIDFIRIILGTLKPNGGEYNPKL